MSDNSTEHLFFRFPEIQDEEPDIPEVCEGKVDEICSTAYQSSIWFDENQHYEGDVYRNCIHGQGFYHIRDKGKETFYDGSFYLNKLEGYCQVFYHNHSHFQGLFKENRRFGPGVYTYPDFQTQDVGFWQNFQIIRLSSVVDKATVPSLASTSLGISKLMKYKCLVPIREDYEDVAREILKKLGASEEILQNSDQLYNNDIQHRNSLFFNRKLYDELFFGKWDNVIEVPVQSSVNEIVQEGEDSTIPNNIKRVERLRAKIQFFYDKIENILPKKQYIQGRVDYCKNCCKISDEEVVQDIDLGSIIGPLGSRFLEDKRISESKMSKGALELGAIFADSCAISSAYTLNTADISGFASNPVSSNYSQNVNFDQDFLDMSGTFDDDIISQDNQQIVDYCACAEDQNIDDLPELEKQLSEVMDEEMFYITVMESLQQKLDAALWKAYEEKRSTRKVVVNEICPWNSDETLIDMFRHCFLCRNLESMVNFDVASLMSSRREELEMPPGSYEKACINFLKNCSTGNHHPIVDAVRNKNINPDLTDARGNSGIFFAASKNQVKVIPILANFGASLNKTNDEGLTPLTLCLLKYISIVFNMKNWETAFLQDTSPEEDKEFFHLYPIRSFLSLSTHSLKESVTTICEDEYANERIKTILNRVASLEHVGLKFREKYAFNLKCREPKKLGTSSSVINLRATRKSRIESSAVILLQTIEAKSKGVLTTILTLLNYGAQPQIGEVPYSPIICSLFTENSTIVKSMLQVDPSATSVRIEDDLTPLHIVASLAICDQNVHIFRHLLDSGADPRLKASPAHWKEQKLIILGETEEESEDYGKNPLHLLCLRKDYESDFCEFFESITEALVNSKIDLDDIYLGHTALSLAVLFGNAQIVNALLKAKKIDPYLLLQYEMGNALTVHALKKYEDFIEIEKAQHVIDVLVYSGMNPLHPVGEYKNCIEFIEKPVEEIIEETHTKGKAKPKKPKKPKVDKKSYQYKITEHLKNLSRQVVIKCAQMRATKMLYDFAEENMLNHQNSITLAELLTPEVATANIKILFNMEIISKERFNIKNCIKLLEFVDLYKKVTKTKKGKEKKKKEPKPKQTTKKKVKMDNISFKSEVSEFDSDKFSSQKFDYDELFSDIEFNKPIEQSVLEIPGLDDYLRYNICFNCLKTTDKTLCLCPRCNLIFYCSEQCNKLGSKLKTFHTCDVLFYENITPGTVKLNSELLDMAKEAEAKCEQRMVMNIRQKIREESDDLYDQWKADKYGIKFCRRNVLKERMKLMKTDFVTSPEPHLYEIPDKRILHFKSITNSIRDYTESVALSLHMASLRLKSAELISITNEKGSTTKQICSEHFKPVAKKSTPVMKPCDCTEALVEAINAKSRSYPGDMLAKFKVLHPELSLKEVAKPVVKTVRKIPKKYWHFLELLSKYCLDVDMSFWYLPYACYSDGQLYYKFLDSDLFTESYSLS